MIKNKFFLAASFSLFWSCCITLFSITVLTPACQSRLIRKLTGSNWPKNGQKKDQFLRTDTGSPITDKKGFAGLTYFAPDPAFRVVARLEPFADKTQKLVVRMSDGKEEVYDKFAHAVFRLQDETCRLLIVKLGDTYSILFRDATSGKATYGGGRYLELEESALTNNQAVLDFNTAYNPYCAYNPGFSCPLPPTENTLPVAISAGEKYVPHE